MKLMSTIRYRKTANNITEISSHGQYAKIGRLRNADVISGMQSLKEWYTKVKVLDNDVFNVIAETIKSRECEILNHFVNRATNAGAESLNSKIKQFRAKLRGVSDVKFFLFRLTKLFA